MAKLLFLPHCLQRESIDILKKEGENKGYEVYVVGGSSMVKKALQEYEGNIQKIVGIACDDELKLSMKYTKHLEGIDIRRVKLLNDGCKNTVADLKEVSSALG